MRFYRHRSPLLSRNWHMYERVDGNIQVSISLSHTKPANKKFKMFVSHAVTNYRSRIYGHQLLEKSDSTGFDNFD